MKEKLKLEYDSISPITGNKCVLQETNDEDNSISYLCMQSGFSSHEKLTEGSEYQSNFERSLTSLMVDCKIVDDEKKIWYPSFMRTPYGMLYIDGQEKTKFIWKVAKIIPIVGKERKKYPIPGKENEFHTSKLDVDNAESFEKEDFSSAIDQLYAIVKEEAENEN